MQLGMKHRPPHGTELSFNVAALITSGTRIVRANATVYMLHNIDRDKTIAVKGID